jgi:predicted DNA-binding transcriptional regulator AlpA
MADAMPPRMSDAEWQERVKRAGQALADASDRIEHDRALDPPGLAHSVATSGGVLTTRGAADYCGLAFQTFRNLLAAGLGPRRYKQGRLNAFLRADLDDWLTRRLRVVHSR